jgi:hypothetical protein
MGAQAGVGATAVAPQVEEEIAAQARFFLGTSISTITHTITYERVGQNRLENEFFEQMDACQ